MASSVARMPSDEWRLHLRPHNPLPTALTGISTSINPSTPAGESFSPKTVAKRRQSLILDRWAARKAREMITTIERQAHEAELSALSTTAQPVSFRAASFLREATPDASVAAAVEAVGEIQTTVRASSLIQMWRELEAEAVCPPPRAGMLSRKVASFLASSSDESELSAAKEIMGNAPTPSIGEKALRVRESREMKDFSLKLEEERRREVAAVGERQLVSRFPFRGRIQSLIRLRSLRQEVATIRHQQWTQKLEEERSNNYFLRERSEDRSQLVPTEERLTVMEVQPLDSDVSAFTIPIDHSDSKNDHFPELSSIREIECLPQAFYTPQDFFTPQPRHEDLQESRSYDASWDERSFWGSSFDLQMSSDSHMLQTCNSEVVSEGIETSTQEQHVASTECKWFLQPSNSSRGWAVLRRTFGNDLLNANFTENGEIQELLEMKAVSTSLASEFSTKMNQLIASFLQKQGQQYADVNIKEECGVEATWRQNYESCSDQEAQLSRKLLNNQESRQNTYLSLSSQILQNQERWQNFSLPLPSQMLPNKTCWQSSSSSQNSSPSVQEGEDMYDLKNSVAQIHHEIFELRKLVESCLDWQKKLGHSIKQELFGAVNQLARRGNQFHNSKCMQGRKDTCCICCEAHIDTLLYRCGHMCACYKCAQELQWSSGKCPICRSLIADVIRAYPNP